MQGIPHKCHFWDLYIQQQYLKGLEKLNADMPVIIEHLESDEEYFFAVEKVKKTLQKKKI